MPDFNLEGRIAIVTGGSRGLGAAIAQGLVEHGATAVLVARKQEELDAQAERLNALRPDAAVGIPAHAGRPEALQELVDAVIARFGRIDILVNNAGTNPYFGPLIECDLTAWDKTFEVNLRGYLALTQLCWRAWMREHGGAGLNIASTAGVGPPGGPRPDGGSQARGGVLTPPLPQGTG